MPVEKLTSREHEVLFSKTSKQLLVLKRRPRRRIRRRQRLQVLEALKRRGVAFAFVDMMSWDSHERYLQTLFSHLRSDPPEGYCKTIPFSRSPRPTVKFSCTLSGQT
jgi:hypothetical protein